ncbi:MAG: hypothetical protein O2967_21310 [Proteobacteria bacterium]|nr:hypothetical protein [Pseudomonadota bacterium]
MRFFTILAISLFGFAGGAMAAPHRCTMPVMEKMAQLDVAEPQIEQISFVDVRSDDRSARLLGYEAWVKLKRCRGSVVVKVSRQCEIQETYSRGECKMTGLKNYR